MVFNIKLRWYNSEALINETFFFLGMRDTGGHGGSSYAEINVPLLVFGVDCSSDGYATWLNVTKIQ